MAALVLHFQKEADRDLFRGLNAVADRLAVLQPDAAAFVERELGVDQIAMVLQQPPDADLVTVEDFLVGLKRQDDIAVGLVALLLVADHVGDEGRRHEFVVAGTASVVIAVFLDQLERIDRPVLAICRHHVDMGKQEDRLARAGTAQPHHKVALARRGLQHLHVTIRKAGRTKARRHCFGRLGGVAGRGHRVDLDEFLVDVVGELLLRGQSLGNSGTRDQRRGKRRRKQHRTKPPNCGSTHLALLLFAVVLDRDHLDLDQKAGIGERCDTDDRTRRADSAGCRRRIGCSPP